MRKLTALMALAALLLAACSDDDDGASGSATPAATTVEPTATASEAAPASADPFAGFSDNVDISFDGDFVVLRSDGVPGAR